MVVSELISRGRGYRCLSLLAALGFLSSCASHRPEIERGDKAFVTNITENGIKLFSYTVTVRDGVGDGRYGLSRGDAVRGRGSRRGKPSDAGSFSGYGSRSNVLKEKLVERVELKLQEIGFCREGYLELDHLIYQGSAQFRGECNEGASEDDRRQFPN